MRDEAKSLRVVQQTFKFDARADANLYAFLPLLLPQKHSRVLGSEAKGNLARAITDWLLLTRHTRKPHILLSLASTITFAWASLIVGKSLRSTDSYITMFRSDVEGQSVLSSSLNIP